MIFALGSINEQLAYLGIVMLIDLIFGIQVARKNKEFKWRTLWTKTRIKVFLYTLWIVMSHAFDQVAGLPDTARWSVLLVLAGLEILSAIKNTSKLGHSRLAEALENMYLALIKPKGGGTDNEDTGEEEEQPKPKRTRKKKSQTEAK